MEPMLIQMKNISSTTQQCRPFQDEEETATQMLESCVPFFFDMGGPVKTQVEHGLSKIFDSQGQTINMSEKAVFILKDPGLHY